MVVHRIEKYLLYMLNYFKPKTISSFESRYSGTISVIDQFGSLKILAGGLLQSGSIIKQLWQKPLNSLTNDHPSEILLLGLGGGTVVKHLRQKYSQAHITAVEIDPVMIKIASKYFHIRNSTKLSIHQADAAAFISKTKTKYDLILVDLFAGANQPEFLYKDPFHQHMNKIMNIHGQVIFNCLFFDQHKHKTQQFIALCEQHLANIHLVHSLSNLFVFASAKKAPSSQNLKLQKLQILLKHLK